MSWSGIKFLKFDDPVQESDFASEYCLTTNNSLKVTLPLVGAFCFGYAMLRIYFGDTLESLIVIGFLVSSVASISGWTLTFLDRLVPFNQHICTIFTVTTIITIRAFHFYYDKLPEPDSYNLVLMVAVVIFRFRFKYAVVAALFNICGILLTQFQFDDIMREKMLVPTLISASVTPVIAAISFLMELRRRSFYRVLKTVAEEQERADALLGAILPAQIKNQIEDDRVSLVSVQPDCVVVFFEVMNGEWTDQSVQSLMELDQVFREIDQVICNFNFETIKTFGNEYVFVAGVLPGQFFRDEEVFEAIAMIELICSARRWKIRAGLAAGALAAGVIGTKTLAFDVWGKPVNLAARMKQHATWGELLLPHEYAIKIGLEILKTEHSNLKGIGTVLTATVGLGLGAADAA